MKFKLLTLILSTMLTLTHVLAQKLDFEKVKIYEHQLDDVMELIDINELKIKLIEVEKDHSQNPSPINKVRLGIIYHEVALNLSFLSQTEFKGYGRKSFEVLTAQFKASDTPQELLPYICSYRASALSLVSSETNSLKLLSQAFELFKEAVDNYSSISYLPEFLRGSVAENLPWFFFQKRKFARRDFQSIIEKYDNNQEYSNAKIMSFTYWAWANQRQKGKHREQSIIYLDKAIALDPNYKAGRKRAEELKLKMTN
ncbi:hypothetical protein ACFOUP_16820 [Belliella kenyensis]|uniref:Tetratricopeptide repeat protein n=1 Tax=Belliella kenyensis TaxID=1472724 RepID=A0ABV8ER46_9BACT|nr:hypothetical protein [Belliella kenyensis]MCH7402888.1 hypothetical protein [Belliella kenyensis]MDN3602594.1 hypothetical protein [Belliella kenyensis]